MWLLYCFFFVDVDLRIDCEWNGVVKSDYIFMASNVGQIESAFNVYNVRFITATVQILNMSAVWLLMKIYFSWSISLLTAVLCFLIWTFSFFYSVWFHIFNIPYPFSLTNYFMFTSTNLLLILGHLVWFVLHPYFYLIVFFWFSSSLFFHCLYFLWTIFYSFHSPPNFHEGNFSTSSFLIMI